MKYLYPESIEKAALILDEVNPDWWDKINVNNLNMRIGNNCILGQLYTSYSKGLNLLFTSLSVYLSGDKIFGINAPVDLWLSEIEKRKNKTMITLKDDDKICYVPDGQIIPEFAYTVRDRFLQENRNFNDRSGRWYYLVPISAEELTRQKSLFTEKNKKTKRIAEIKAEQERLEKELKELES